MSQKATDHAVLVVTYSLGSLAVGASLSAVLLALGTVSTTTVIVVSVAAASIPVSIGIAFRLIGRAVRDGAQALPDNITNYGPTYIQQTQITSTSSWFGRTTNNPR